MRGSLLSLALPCLLTAACGGGGGGGGGGIDYVSEGQITRFGTVTAAGTTWDTDAAEIVVDGTPNVMLGDESGLVLGMKVTLEGVPDAGDDALASAVRVEYDDDVQGMVVSVTEVGNGLDGAPVRELEILGRTVVMTAGVTLFDGTDFGSITAGDWVEVSGFPGEDGRVLASWIADRTAEAGDVELKGMVSGLVEMGPSSSFMLEGVLVGYDTLTTGFKGLGDDDFTAGVPSGALQDGDFVEVRGDFDDPDVDATTGTIEVESPFEGRIPNFEIEGVLTQDDELRIGGQPVSFGLGVQYVPPSLLLSLALGDFIEVEGELNDGVLVADVVRLLGGEARAAAEIADPMDVDTDAGSFLLLGGLEVQVDDATRFDPDCEAMAIQDIDSLAAAVPIYVDVHGVDLAGQAGAMRALVIACSGMVDADLRGRVAQADGDSIVILGIDLPVAGAMFQDFPMGTVGDEMEFFAWIASNPGALLEVRDDDGAIVFDGADTVVCADLDACQ